jgi:hypothetical protein
MGMIMNSKDIWLMTYDIMQTSHNNGGDYCEPKIRKITQEYITKNICKNYIGRAGSFNDDKIYTF